MRSGYCPRSGQHQSGRCSQWIDLRGVDTGRQNALNNVRVLPAIAVSADTRQAHRRDGPIQFLRRFGLLLEVTVADRGTLRIIAVAEEIRSLRFGDTATHAHILL